MRTIDRIRSPWVTAAALAVLICLGERPGGGTKAAAQAPAKEPSGADRLRQMRALAKNFSVVGSGGAADRSSVGSSADPIFRYDEPARGFLDGTLWAFGDQGRPTAILEAEIHADCIVYGLVSLAPATLAAKGVNGWRWSSTRPGLEWKPIPGAPGAAATERERLLQMKTLARRFSAVEDDGPVHGKLSLRLLSQPIYRYGHDAHENPDGAIFGFATGTNPDVLLLVEPTHAPGGPASSWKYSFARIGGADLTGRLDGNAV